MTRPLRTKLLALVALAGVLGAEASIQSAAAEGGPLAARADDELRAPAAQQLASPAPAAAGTAARSAGVVRAAATVPRFHEGFDIDPASPRSFADTPMSRRWHVAQAVTDFNQWRLGDAVQAQHGPDCGPPPATHRADRWKEYVYVCKNHVMTARAAPSYAATYLMPKALLDWSSRRAVARWDVSTVSMSGRDWIDLWVTPIGSALMVPIDRGTGVAFQGAPRNAIHVRGANGGDSWTVEVIRKNKVVGRKTLTIPASFQRSAKTRTPMRLWVGPRRVTFRMSGVGTIRVPAGPNFRRGLVQWGHHAYNPAKDGAGVPATWHWDNFTLAPASALGANEVRPQRRIAGPGDRRVFRFRRPARARSVLLFDAVCKVAINFGDGPRRLAKQPTSDGNNTLEFASSYKVKVPRGATRAVVRFRGDGWYDGWPCVAENPIIIRNLRNPPPVPASWG